MAELRAISEDARAERVEAFRDGAERVLARPDRLVLALQVVRAGSLGARDAEAVAESVAAAIASYAESRTSGYWGPGLDSEGFFDEVVRALPSFPPALAESLLHRLVVADALSGRHAWMCAELARIEGTRTGAWEAMEHLHARGWATDQQILALAEDAASSDGAASIRARAWCALVRRDPKLHLARAMDALDRSPSDSHAREQLAVCIAQEADAIQAFELLRDLLPERPAMTPNGLRLFQRFDSVEMAAQAMDAFAVEPIPERRCYLLAMAHGQPEFLAGKAKSDPSPLVRAWATYFRFTAGGAACERLSILMEFLHELGRGRAFADENRCVDRVLEMLRVADVEDLACTSMSGRAWVDSLSLIEAPGRGLSEGRRGRLRARMARFRERAEPAGREGQALR